MFKKISLRKIFLNKNSFCLRKKHKVIKEKTKKKNQEFIKKNSKKKYFFIHANV